MKLTVPVGVVGPLLSVSVTVAVHVTDWPTATVSGEQLTAVEVESGAVYVRLTSLLALAPAGDRTSLRQPRAGLFSLRKRASVLRTVVALGFRPKQPPGHGRGRRMLA